MPKGRVVCARTAREVSTICRGGQIRSTNEAKGTRLANGRDESRGIPAAGQRRLDHRVAKAQPTRQGGRARHDAPPMTARDSSRRLRADTLR